MLARWRSHEQPATKTGKDSCFLSTIGVPYRPSTRSAVEAVAGSFAARAQLLVALSLFAGIVVLTDRGKVWMLALRHLTTSNEVVMKSLLSTSLSLLLLFA